MTPMTTARTAWIKDYIRLKRYMLSIFIKYISSFMAIIFGSSAIAGESGPGVVVDLQVDGSNAVFAVTGPHINKPGCAVWDRYVFEITTPSSQAMFAFLLTAQATGKQIRVYGTQTCSVASNHETALSVRDAQ